jgi:hypothetical protein
MGVDEWITLKYIFKKCEGVTEWIVLAQDKDRWQFYVNAVMNFLFP